MGNILKYSGPQWNSTAELCNRMFQCEKEKD